MADKSLASDRSRSPAGSKGDGFKGDVCELDEKFLVLWAKHVEPKMVEKTKSLKQKSKTLLGLSLKRKLIFWRKKSTLDLLKLRQS